MKTVEEMIRKSFHIWEGIKLASNFMNKRFNGNTVPLFCLIEFDFHFVLTKDNKYILISCLWYSLNSNYSI